MKIVFFLFCVCSFAKEADYGRVSWVGKKHHISFDWDLVRGGLQVGTEHFKVDDMNIDDVWKDSPTVKAGSSKNADENDPVYTTFLYSSYPTKQTKEIHIKQSEYIYHLDHQVAKVSNNSFDTHWDGVNNEVLYEILKHAVWIRADFGGYDSKDEYISFYAQGSGFFIDQNKIITARHVISSFNCYSPDLDQIALFEYKHPKKCKSNHVQLSLQNSTVVISQHLKSYYPMAIFMVRTFVLNYFERNYGIKSFEIGSESDVTLVATKIDNEYNPKYKLQPFQCKVNDKVLIIGHPNEITHDVPTKDGFISREEANHYLYSGTLTIIGKSVITVIKCNEKNHYQFEFDGIAWNGISGSMVVLQRDPTKLCGSVSRSSNVSPYGYVTTNIGICSNHPIYEWGQKQKEA